MFIRTIRDKLKTRQFVFTKSALKPTGLKYIAIEIWGKIPLEIKNKPCLTLTTVKYKKCVTRILEIFLVLFLLVCINQVH